MIALNDAELLVYEIELALAVYHINRKWRMNDAYVNTHIPPIIYADKASHEEPKTMTTLGGKDVASMLKGRMAASRAKASQVQTDIVAALDKFDSTLAVGADIAKTASDEADAMMAEFGQISNGGPA